MAASVATGSSAASAAAAAEAGAAGLAKPSLVERHTQKAYNFARKIGLPVSITLYVTSVLIIILSSTYIHAYNNYFTEDEKLENKGARTLHVLSLVFAVLVIVLLSVAMFYYARYRREDDK